MNSQQHNWLGTILSDLKQNHTKIDFEMEQTMQVDDHLAALFRRNLNLDATVSSQPISSNEPMDMEVESSPPVIPPPVVYSISQHYHHSAHAVFQTTQPTDRPRAPELSRSISVPVLSEHQSAEAILLKHAVDPSSLAPSQLQLFRNADPSQQMRLIELWRICPPPPSGHMDSQEMAWTETSVQRQEHLVGVSYDHLHERGLQGHEVFSLDGTQIPVQTADGRWTATDASTAYSEPYMISGYMDLFKLAPAGHETAGPANVFTGFGVDIGSPSSGYHTTAANPMYSGTAT